MNRYQRAAGVQIDAGVVALVNSGNVQQRPPGSVWLRSRSGCAPSPTWPAC